MSRDGHRHEIQKHVGYPVRLVWVDAVGKPEWMSYEDVCKEPPWEIESYGFLVHVDKDAVRIAGDVSQGFDGGRFNMVGVVPLGWVKSCERLTIDKGAHRDA